MTSSASAESAAEPVSDPTSTRETDLVRRINRSLPPAMLAVLIIAMARVGGARLDNFDTYFHLRFGHEFLSGSWSLRHPGHVSTFETADWLPTQWLPEVVMAWLEDRFGLPGVAWFSGLQLCSLALVLYVVTRRQASVLITAAMCLFTLIAAEDGLSMRPQVVSYLCVAVVSAAWLRARDSGRTPWWLIPMSWVWAMYHGMWPIGIVISLVAVAGILLDLPAGEVRSRLRFLLVPLGSLIVGGLTPVGPGLYAAVLQVNSRGRFFTEWGPPDFSSIRGAAILAMVALCVAALARGPRSGWFKILMLVLAVLWMVYSERTLPVAAALLCPLGARCVQDWTTRPRPVAPRSERWPLVGVYVASLVVLAFVVPHTADQPIAEPSWLAPAMESLPAGTPVMDDQGLGAYLMWDYPGIDIVSHGYGDVYTTAELVRNQNIATVGYGWDVELKATGARYALLNPGARLTYALVDEHGWTVVHGSLGLDLLEAPPDW